MSSSWTRKDLLGIADLSLEELQLLLETARRFKSADPKNQKKFSDLQGRTLVNLFIEPSTRTRTSFELAATRLGADVVNINATASSLTKGESLKDTALTLQANHVDFIVIRHPSAGSAKFLADRLDASVINAGDGAHEHPTQALLDLFTIQEKKGAVENLHVGIVGDILFSRVARSNIWGLLKLGAKVTLIGPSTLIPKAFEQMGVQIANSLDDVIEDLDVINLLRIQHERQKHAYFPSLGEYTSMFGLTKARAKRLKKDCVIMHPGPINRGVEIDSDIADDLSRSVILEQVTNGLVVRMSVLYHCGLRFR